MEQDNLALHLIALSLVGNICFVLSLITFFYFNNVLLTIIFVAAFMFSYGTLLSFFLPFYILLMGTLLGLISKKIAIKIIDFFQNRRKLFIIIVTIVSLALLFPVIWYLLDIRKAIEIYGYVVLSGVITYVIMLLLKEKDKKHNTSHHVSIEENFRIG